MTTKDAAKLREKREAARISARRGHCYRTFEAACEDIVLTGNFYNLPLTERIQWEEKARKAGVALGLVKP